FAALPLERGAARPTTGTTIVTNQLEGETQTGQANNQTSAQQVASFSRVGEVAKVSLHAKEQRRGSRLNGRPAINLEVFADAGASPVEVSEQVREVVEALRLDPSLGGVDVAVFEDQGTIILDTLGDLRDTGIY